MVGPLCRYTQENQRDTMSWFIAKISVFILGFIIDFLYMCASAEVCHTTANFFNVSKLLICIAGILFSFFQPLSIQGLFLIVIPIVTYCGLSQKLMFIWAVPYAINHIISNYVLQNIPTAYVVVFAGIVYSIIKSIRKDAAYY